jgi:hypothetical protein
LLLVVLALDASAQYPSRNRGGSPRDRPSQSATPAATSNDPFSALERELPSLEVDLVLKPEQLDAWRVFARDVRDIAEMDRARRKHATAARDSTALIASLAEDARERAEAADDLKRHYGQLYGALDDGQRRTIDRRVIQSQVEPLGR